MIKYFKYIIFIFLLIGCFQINKPFQNSKVTSAHHNSINSIIYIDNIIGVPKKVDLELKNKINNKLLKKNILSSYEYFNENNYIIKTTLIEYTELSIIKIIFNITNSKAYNRKLEIILPDKNIYDSNIQDKITDKITDFIERNVFNINKIQYLKITEIKGLKHNKKLKNIFYKKLEKVFSINSFKILDKENNIDEEINNYSSLKINFSFNEVDKEKVTISIIWEVTDKNDKLLGTIKQENIIKKSIINYVWEEISNKIIEMSIAELNMIINL